MIEDAIGLNELETLSITEVLLVDWRFDFGKLKIFSINC
jgi:hypothetical protein